MSHDNNSTPTPHNPLDGLFAAVKLDGLGLDALKNFCFGVPGTPARDAYDAQRNTRFQDVDWKEVFGGAFSLDQIKDENIGLPGTPARILYEAELSLDIARITERRSAEGATTVYSYAPTTGMVYQCLMINGVVSGAPYHKWGPVSQEAFAAMTRLNEFAESGGPQQLEKLKTALFGPVGTPKRDYFEAQHRETIANIQAARERPPAV